MRCLGEIEGQIEAEKFVAHLLTLDISTQLETVPNTSKWEIWVREEDRLGEAGRELKAFEVNPNDAKYDEAVAKARKILEEKEKARLEAIKNVRKIDTRSSPRHLAAGGKLPPLTLTLFVLCLGIGLLTEVFSPSSQGQGARVKDQLSFVSYEDYVKSDGDAAASLKKFELWRTITPIFIHIGVLHLAMNMFMLYSFGRLVERWIGTPMFALLVLVLAIVPNLFQGLAPEWMHGNPIFGGISGVLYGLLGFVWIRTTINPTHGFSIPFPIMVVAIGLIVVGLSGAIENWRLADLAHLGGLLVGSGFGFAAEQANS